MPVKMPDDGSIKSVKRFDGTNFQVFKFQLTTVLLANKIFAVVDESRTRPADAEGAIAGRIKSWIKDNAKTMAIIASAMENEQVNSIIVCGTSKEMWDKLVMMHEQKSASNVETLTQSLTSKYSIFKTAWDSVHPERQTVSYLLERLIREEQSLSEEGDSAGALAVARQSNSKGDSRSKDESDKKIKKRSKKNVECYRCQEKGVYYASQCPKKKSQGENNNNNKCQVQELLSADIKDVWITDSGASEHITFRREWLEDLRSVKDEKVLLDDDGECEVTGIGKVRIEKLVDGKWESGLIENVLLMPRYGKLHKLPFNKKSTRASTQPSLYIVMYAVRYQYGQQVVHDSMYSSRTMQPRFEQVWAYDENSTHRQRDRVSECQDRGYLKEKGITLETTAPYTPEQNGRTERDNRTIVECARTMLQAKQLPAQLWAEATATAVYTLNRTGRSCVGGSKTPYEQWTGKKPNLGHMRVFGSDAYHGISHCATAPHTPEQNGRSEQDNWTIVECARTMLQAKQLPAHLWAEATATAVYTLNRMRRSCGGGSKTPYKLWTGKKPNLGHMRVFGSNVYVHVPKQKMTQFEARAKKLILVGYDNTWFLMSGQLARTQLYRRRGVGVRGPLQKRVFLPLSEEDEEAENENEEADGNGAVERNADVDDAAAVNAAREQAAVGNNENAVEGNRQQQQKVDSPRTLQDRATLRGLARYQVILR
ncbi:uncharacterized protein [Temnothorax longispinosus]|uniref:uncharacterized protein n=1 Tax=Temnothorax longispinosus TaxID=300112 RepID=UPI003A98F402